MISIKGLEKSFSNNKVLNNIDFYIGEGEVVGIIGPSGSGKSTFLRCINYLEKPDKGNITIDNQSIDYEKITNSEIMYLRINTAMVFQRFNLFYNKNVIENITEGLITVQKKSKEEAEEIAWKLLKNIGLEDKVNAMPSTLSGGQQQRVGIARAVALNPKVILFDEPTSALDPELVSEVLQLIKNLANNKQTMIIVTHEIQFAKNVADRICFLDKGQIIEQGKAEEIINNPSNPRTQEFLNKISLRT